MKSRARASSPTAAITQRIIAEIEKGTVPWVKPWRRLGAPQNAVSGRKYTGFNALALTLASHVDPRYLTFRQTKLLGGHVRKGEHGYQVVGWFEKEARRSSSRANQRRGTVGSRRESRGEKPQKRLYPRVYTVFNVAQCENLKIKPLLEESQGPAPAARHERAEAFIQAVNAPYRPAAEAFYSPGQDRVHWPPKQMFKDVDEYYATAFHELAHYSGGEARLNRKFGLKGTRDYAKEELVAELASAFLCAEHGINGAISHNAGYLEAWLKVLKEEPQFLFQAAGQAQKAVDYLSAEKEKNLAKPTPAKSPAPARSTRTPDIVPSRG